MPATINFPKIASVKQSLATIKQAEQTIASERADIATALGSDDTDFVSDLKQLTMFKRMVEYNLFWLKYTGLPSALNASPQLRILSTPLTGGTKYWFGDNSWLVDTKRTPIILAAVIDSINGQLEGTGIVAKTDATNLFVVFHLP